MSDAFPIPAKVRDLVDAQMRLDGTIEENIVAALLDLEPLDRIFPPPQAGEAGVLADAQAMVNAGLARWT